MYPLSFVKDAIAEVMGNTVEFFDGGAGVARETRRRAYGKGIIVYRRQKMQGKYLKTALQH